MILDCIKEKLDDDYLSCGDFLGALFDVSIHIFSFDKRVDVYKRQVIKENPAKMGAGLLTWRSTEAVN